MNEPEVFNFGHGRVLLISDPKARTLVLGDRNMRRSLNTQKMTPRAILHFDGDEGLDVLIDMLQNLRGTSRSVWTQMWKVKVEEMRSE